MSMPKITKLITVVMSAILLSACGAAQIKPMPVSQDMFNATGTQTIGIVLSKIPETDMTYPGAGCLLCLGAAAAMNSTLSSYVDTLDASDFKSVQSDLAKVLTDTGKRVILIDDTIDIKQLPDYSSDELDVAEMDFTGFSSTNNLTHLLVIDVHYVGVKRDYASYIPTSAPYAQVNGRAFLVDMQTNAYKWYLPVSVSQSVDGEWDEPEDFPGLTNAFYQSIERAKENIVLPLSMVQNSSTN